MGFFDRAGVDLCYNARVPGSATESSGKRVFGSLGRDAPRLLLLSMAAGLIYLLYHRLGSPLDITGEKSTVLWTWIRWNSVDHTCGKLYRYLGPLIPVVSLLLVWREREALRRLPRSTSWAGLGCVALALVMHWAGVKSEHVRLSILSFVVLVFGGVWFLQGGAVARRLVYPVGFLGFLVPLNFLNSAVNQFRVLTGRIAAAVLTGLGIECRGRGMAIVGVGEEPFRFVLQAGPVVFRDLLLLLIFGSLAAYLSQPGLGRRVLFFALLFPVYAACAIGVITVTGLLVQVFGEGVRGVIGDNVMSAATFLLLAGAGGWMGLGVRRLGVSGVGGRGRGLA